MGDIKKGAGKSDKIAEAMEVDAPDNPKMESKVKKQLSDNKKSGDESLKEGNDSKLFPNEGNAKKRSVKRKSEDSVSEESVIDAKEGLLKVPKGSEKGMLK